MKKIICFVGVLLFIVSSIYTLSSDRKRIIEYPIDDMENIKVNYNKDIIRCNIENKDNILRLEITPVRHGKTNIIIKGNVVNNEKIEKINYNIKIFVHRFKIITVNNYLGHFNGDIYFFISFYIIMLLSLVYNIGTYLINIKERLYSYENTRLLGLIIFITGFLLYNIFFFIYDYFHGYTESIFVFINELQENLYIFLMMIFPFVLITILLVMISNFVLLKREGKRWRNMLGIILGLFLIFVTVIITFSKVFIRFNSFMDTVIINYIIDCFTVMIVYFECILVGTIVSGIISARHIPKFDKDAIIILGCKIKEDGTLTNLLKSRVDRAIEFSKMQMENTGKDIFFVPSGGKGSDEIISEAEAMKGYLIDMGIDKKKILLEDKSTSTYQNMKYSNKIINDKINNPKIAFSTTNYHVFRSGIIAAKQNINIEGIGARTKSYYWINAFIREFIATIVSEKKNHIKTILILMGLILLITVITVLAIII